MLAGFQNLRRELAGLAEKLQEMAAEAQEHDLTLKALEPLEPGRRCYRQARGGGLQPVHCTQAGTPLHLPTPLAPEQVGDVLIEQSVALVVPAVTSQREQVAKVRPCQPLFAAAAGIPASV